VVAERILHNPVYRNVAGALAGSDAYMALEQLLDIAESPDFDLIVVDTPPASHALELFDAPERILALLGSKALEYLAEPIRILGVATSRLARGLLSAVLAALERMTGLTLLRDVSGLAADFGVISPAFRERAESISALLRDARTRYVLMASPDPHGARDTVQFAAEILGYGIDLHAVVVNRVLRLEPSDPSRRADGPSTGNAAEPHAAWSASLARNLVACARDLQALRSGQLEVIEALREGLTKARRARPSLARVEPIWIELPALFPAPTTLAGIAELGKSFALSPEPLRKWG
jgi:anion-transporting  ArsA/GET3 family ATPase